MIAEVEERRAALEELCRRFEVERLELFGSAARGDFRPEESDIDFLVEFQRRREPGYADRFFGLLEALEEMFGRRVDLVVDSAITNPYVRKSIEQNRTLLYAA